MKVNFSLNIRVPSNRALTSMWITAFQDFRLIQINTVEPLVQSVYQYTNC